jgi:hypothetical protein
MNMLLQPDEIYAISVPRLTHNAVLSYKRLLSPQSSISGAYRELRHACARGELMREAPPWLSRIRGDSEGYLVLEGEIAVLPIRRGRAVACLANPLRLT